MGTSSTTVGSVRTTQHHIGGEPRLDSNGVAESATYTQTLTVLIFRGYPRDTEDSRMIEFYLAADDSATTSTAFRLEGHTGMYWVKVTPRPGVPHSRPHYLRQFFVAAVPVASASDSRLRNAIMGTLVNNEDPEFTRFSWIADVISSLSAGGFITSEEGDEVVDQTINAIYDAPYGSEPVL
ncbi:hypothetical protein JX266_004073 [Neoarthrinium moseri]|nr:hypothetical protein JX266_004073 [Neoarthrinium moseri]